MFRQDSSCPGVLWIPPCRSGLRIRGFHPLRQAFPEPSGSGPHAHTTVPTPECMHSGLAFSPSARRYSGNRFFFPFLRLLGCFGSPGSPPRTMDSCADARGLPVRVSPFRHLRITGYVPLPAAFRSLSRLSSAPGARASALCLSCLTSFRLSPAASGNTALGFFPFSFPSEPQCFSFMVCFPYD